MDDVKLMNITHTKTKEDEAACSFTLMHDEESIVDDLYHK